MSKSETPSDLVANARRAPTDLDALDELGFLTPSFTLAFLKASSDSVSLLTPDGTLRFMNQNGLALLGFARDDNIAGLDWVSLWPEVARGTVRKALLCARGGDVARYADWLSYLNAPDMACAVTLCPISNSAGEVEAILAILRKQEPLAAE